MQIIGNVYDQKISSIYIFSLYFRHEKTENECGIDLPNFTVIVLSVVIARKILP